MKEETTQDERVLNKELKKLINTANKRLLSIERKTGIKEGFATKQLYDYLSSSPIQAITKGKRISYKIGYTLMQKKAIIKAVNEFLISNASSVRSIKSYIKKLSFETGKKISYKMADTIYKVTHNFDWLWDTGIVPSQFWRNLAPKVSKMEKDSWVDIVEAHMTKMPDKTIKRNLEYLYNYLKNG